MEGGQRIDEDETNGNVFLTLNECNVYVLYVYPNLLLSFIDSPAAPHTQSTLTSHG